MVCAELQSLVTVPTHTLTTCHCLWTVRVWLFVLMGQNMIWQGVTIGSCTIYNLTMWSQSPEVPMHWRLLSTCCPHPEHLTPASLLSPAPAQLIMLASDWSGPPSARPLIGQLPNWFTALVLTASVWWWYYKMGINVSRGGTTRFMWDNFEE